MTLPPADTGRARWSRFAALCSAQTLSMTGGGVTSFALGVWIFERTGSATAFSMLSVCATLPAVLGLPLAGVMADRWGPRRALVAAEIGGALIGVALVGLLWAGLTEAWQVGAVVALGAAIASLHWPAYTSATSALCSPEQLPRAAALMNLGYAGQQVLAPALGGVLLSTLGLSWILGLDIVTYSLATVVVALALRGLPQVPATGASPLTALREAVTALKGTGLLRAARYVALTYLPGGFVVALATPLALTLTTTARVGVVWSIIGVGMLAGTGVSSALVRGHGGVRRMLRFDLAMGLSMVGMGLWPSEWSVAAAGFVFLFGLAGHMSEEQALWQVRVPQALQGRALALRRLMTWSALPVSYALAGPLADYLFEPLLAESGALAGSLGQVIGVGPGRGIALLLMVAGSLKLCVVAWASRDGHLAELNKTHTEEGL